MYVLGIDAANLRDGGGRTHLIEFLRLANPSTYGFSRVVLWGARSTLSLVDDRPWLIKRNPGPLDKGWIWRTFWQRFKFARDAKEEGCDLLFIPGGSYAGDFHPVVSMCRNMLPFQWDELRRYGWSLMTIRMLLLRLIQIRTFRRSDGVIFLTEFARRSVLNVTGKLEGRIATIPHGLSKRFDYPPRQQFGIDTYSKGLPYRLIYVSIVDQYKHQWNVVEAVGRLRNQTGWPLMLDLVGPYYSSALPKLEKSIVQWDPDGTWVTFHGKVPYTKLHQIYSQANLGIFASSCENMPNILLEMMGAGLPIACSNFGPMPDVLGEGGVYFNPMIPKEISRSIERLVRSVELRALSAKAGYERSRQFEWARCADQTFQFLSEVLRNPKRQVVIETD